MKLSVALATYNGGKYIVEQLRSIKDQTRPVDEVVIVDDCSTDDTVRAVRGFLAENDLPGWRLFVNRENLGYAENFRRAMEACTGDLIFLCDQDDVWAADRAEVMAGAMERDAQIGLINTRFLFFDSGGTVPTAPRPEAEDLAVRKIELDRKTVFLQYPGCVMCVRKSFYDRYKRYWRKGWAHDAFLWGMAVQSGSCYAMEYVSLLRRVHEGQTSGQVGHGRAKRIRYLEGVREDGEMLLRAAVDAGCPGKTVRLYERLVRTHRRRLELVRDRKLTRALALVFDLGYYHRARSYPVELLLALKGD